MESLTNFQLIDIVRAGMSIQNLYSLCNFAIEMSKQEDGRYNHLLFDTAVIDAFAIAMFDDVSDKLEGKDLLEAMQYLNDNGYLEKIETEHKDLLNAVREIAENELWYVTDYETSTGVILRDFMSIMNKTFSGLSDKAELNIANEDVQSVLQIAEKYGMK